MIEMSLQYSYTSVTIKTVCMTQNHILINTFTTSTTFTVLNLYPVCCTEMLFFLKLCILHQMN